MSNRHPEFHYRWQWQLKSTPEALWPYISDTNRFNRDTKLPSIERLLITPSSQKEGYRPLRLHLFGLKIEWDEAPFEWIRPSRFGVLRRYHHGPIEELRMLAELKPQRDRTTELVYQIWARPRNFIGSLIIPFQIGLLTKKQFNSVFHHYDQLALREPLLFKPTSVVQFPSGGQTRLTASRQTLIEKGPSPQLVNQLIEVIEHADDYFLNHLRPYLLADRWHESRRQVLELCLHATRIGVLDFRWDLLCPLCRGAEKSAATLAEMPTAVHCNSCNIDFDINFERSVELSFRPNAAIRKMDVKEFCAGSPQLTPHIVIQQLLEPIEKRTLNIHLEEGRYRLRVRDRKGGQFLQVTQKGLKETTLQITANEWPTEELQIGTETDLHLENLTSQKQLLILERTAWNDQAVTAAEVIALQVFRDLFSSEALRPGNKISVGSLTILFTDLLHSTKLYREVGDAPAFGYVMSHFDILREAIRQEEGALIKTIGDSVMAVFRHPVASVRAALRAQQKLLANPFGGRPLLLKVGIHHGPCIAVNLNDQLDYFGSTVNIAARLVALSAGNDIIISASIQNDPEVSEFITQNKDKMLVKTIETTLKGFEKESFDLWRLRRLHHETVI